MKRLLAWRRPKPVATYRAALLADGRGAWFTLYQRLDGGHEWGWAFNERLRGGRLGQPDDQLHFRAKAAVVEMERRLGLPLSFDEADPARRAPDWLKEKLPGWPWDATQKPETADFSDEEGVVDDLDDSTSRQ